MATHGTVFFTGLYAFQRKIVIRFQLVAEAVKNGSRTPEKSKEKSVNSEAVNAKVRKTNRQLQDEEHYFSDECHVVHKL